MAGVSSIYSLSGCLSRVTPSLCRNIAGVSHQKWLCAAASMKQHQSSAEPGSSSRASENDSATDTSAEQAPDPQAELNKQIEILSSDVANYKDKYQRALAERENVRTRLEKQVSDAKLYGIQGFCKDLLEVSDVFRKALESVPEEELKSSTNGHLKTLYDGLSMTETQMLTVFKRHGLVRVPLEPGQPFDPSWQEAMFEVASDGSHKAGSVAHVLRPGWKLHDRCIRSAQVGVIKEY
ncbi:grpE protein homolog, mitochondrial [Hyalella azteca]|uniref:GrpE protein homolog, mitochondrial n=1 Tax=Hyalella azteca TaxID=294128 RepID=A0A8B7NX04_HYAAZ|nr:grpE protein homolog, mitochondrial [Hyalella azteca]